MVKKSKTKTKTVKPVRRKRHDWNKTQKEFDLYKLKNRNKTLKDFCRLKKINYNTASKRIKYGKSTEIVRFYDQEKYELCQ